MSWLHHNARVAGRVAQVCFCIGLYAAAYSSAITIPLGAALTAQQMFLEGRYAGTNGDAASLDDSAASAGSQGEDGHAAGDVDGEEQGYNTRLVRTVAPRTAHLASSWASL